MPRNVPAPVPRPVGVAHTPAYPEADLTNCDREPIHLPGAIQPHGLLIALAVDADEVVAVSTNSAELLGLPASEAIGGDLARLVGADLAAQVALRIAQGLPEEPLQVDLPADLDGSWAGTRADVHLFQSQNRVIVEFEPAAAGGEVLSHAAARVPMARLTSSRSLPELTDRLAEQVKALLGFDRVMVYRFDAHWNGEVVAEHRRDDLEPFLGLHYPATDIPAQARRLYTVNSTRLIVDVGYRPVPLEPITDPATGAPLDLSFSWLRSVSPLHLEYLANMGVTASMSISLVVDDKLWGLVACHHYSGPHRPTQDARSAAGFLGEVASHLIGERELSERRDAALQARTMLAGIVNRLAASPQDPMPTLAVDPEVLTLMDAGGVAIADQDLFWTAGDVPSENDLRQISRALADKEKYVTYTDQVGLLEGLTTRPGLERLAAGALRIGDEDGRWVLWLRPECELHVDWGGDPRSKAAAAAEGPDVRLSPRKSFAKWREVVQGRSLPWESWQTEAADALGIQMTGLQFSRTREHVRVAEAVQESVVLGVVPQFPGLDVAARYLPAATLQMGGDWWDVFEVTPGRVALIVGDVAGHGVDAASTMVQLRTALRAYLYAGSGAAKSLDQLDHLLGHLLSHQVATAVVAIIDLADGNVEIAAAGHLPPLLTKPEGTVELDVDARPLLGFEFEGAQTTTFRLTPGATLVFYSDGLVERRGVDTDARTHRLMGLATYEPDASLEDWIDMLLSMRDGTEDDDTTVLAMRRPLDR